ncbi:flagellar hook-associated protein FlgK [Loktanella agnita]|uniref:flagellar hook-associated protein FlgK n=1 Tax=Loktanella agnita TaxID=287097 RepID=UPI0039891619
MSIASALNNALSGLAATSRTAEIVSSNLSNALTDGYGRRSVQLSSAQVGNSSGGVQVVGIQRHVDAAILSDRRLADASLKGQEFGAAALNRLELALGGPDSERGLSARLAAFEQALISSGSDPGSELRLTTVVSRLHDVTDTLRSNTQTIQEQRQAADGTIARTVETLNTALKSVEALNNDIMRLKATGTETSALYDARQRAVDQVAAIVPIREMQRDSGMISLFTTSGAALLESRAIQFGFEPTPTIVADMSFAGGTLSGITADGVPVSATNGIGQLDGGSLGAAFALRDETLVETQNALDDIAADLIARFQDPANDPTLTAGDLGLLTDQGNPLDPADTLGLAGRINVNPAIDPASGGELRLLRDGLNSVVAGAPGDPAQLDRWIMALEVPRADLPGMTTRTAAGRIADFTASVGNTRLNAEQKLSFTAARWDTLREAELSNGVDTDIELQILLQVEQAYAANAKVVETVDFMMQRLMEI